MYYLLIILNAITICFSSENVPPLSGFYTEGLEKGLDKIEIVYPEKVSKDGSFVSYYLPHYYNIESPERPRRAPGFPTGPAKNAIHFFVPINGEKHHLELWPNMNFISPGLVVERRDARDVENINKAKISQISQRQCHYSGKIVGKGNSSAALSTCNGLAGYIRIPAGDEYLIEPVKDSKPDHDKEHPHIIYKRSSMKNRLGGTNCLTKGRSKEAFEDRMQWEALYGDQVRKEMSGVNINEVIQESNKAATSPQAFESVLSPNSVGKDYSQTMEKLHNINNLDEAKAVNFNEPQIQISTNQYRSNVEKQDYLQPLNSEQAASSRNIYTGNKLNKNVLKEERSMGNIQLPDLNAGPLKTVQSDEKPVQLGYVNSAGKQSKVEILEHRRVKRELNTDHEEREFENKENPNKIINDNHNSNKDKAHEHMAVDTIKNIKKIDQRSISSSINKASKNQIIRNDDNVDQNTNINNIEMDSNENDVFFKKQSDVGKLKNIKRHKIKRDYSETKHVSAEQCNSSTGMSKNDPSRSELSSKIPNDSKDNIIPLTDNEKDIKREIHLDTSEKSWQPNDKVDNIKISPGKVENDKLLSEEKTGSQSPTQSLHNLENDKTKESDSKSIKVDRDNFSDDETIMADVVEVVVNDINKLKVKKDINNVLSNVKPEKKFKQQEQSNQKLPENADERFSKTNQMFLSIPNNVQDKDLKIIDNTQKILTKESNKNVLNNEKETVAQTHDIPNKNSNNVDEIIIRIKAPEGTVNDVKQKLKLGHENIKSDQSFLFNTSDDNDDKILNSQNNNINQKLLKSYIINKNKLAHQVDSVTFNDQNEKSQSQEAMDAEIQQQIIKQTSNSNNAKNKREDTIHLIIETEPEVNAYNEKSSEARPNLFCQGKNCLEIKPVVLNDSNVAAVSPPINSQSTNKSTNIDSKQKVVEKREVEEGSSRTFEECNLETTTLKPLLCFDFFNRLFNLELMIAVDYKVVKMHDDDDIENFILTIVNMVSTNFYDKSIGINLSVSLIRLILLTTCIKELDSDQFNPEELLENFCTWQVLINPGKDDHPHHHDLAIFVTRMDKCEGQVMGVSYMTSVCRPDKACLVCIDEGLLLANTITHQIGHSFGAEHDDSQSSGCSSTAPDGTSYHMAPTIRETSYSWSVCSRDSIIQFLRTQGSWCLTDQVEERAYNFPLMLPGQIYSAAQQCRLNYHMAALPCAIGSFCDKLYCQVTEKLCATKGDPPADGTFCAADMWCFHRECVHIGRRPGAINGEWGPWTEWSTCTRSCGGGVSSSYRICNNPKPAHGGRYCIGDRIRHKMCATKPCQGFTESFRDLQCKKTEDRPFRGKLSNWVQYQSFFINIECALVCQNRKGEVVMRSPIVADGTPCKAGTRNVCIQGACRNVGCDWVIDSFAKEDACGMCHGNSTECKIIQGVFDEATNQRGMVEFLRVPKNSGMVFVREIAPSTNVLAVSGAINRVFYLNGQGTDDSMPGDVAFGMTHGVYEIRSSMERIFIRGPTTEDLLFYISFREPNRGIHYQYAVPDFDPTYVPRYLWQYLDWETCTDPCSGGSQRARAKCVEDRGGVVDDNFCTQSSRPMDIIRPCNEFPCQAKWWVSVWSDCICTGSASLMFRSVLCMRATDESGTRSEIVKESECANYKKPTTQKLCNETDDYPESCFIKRSVTDDDMQGYHRDMRRAINPNTAYVIMSPANLNESGSQESALSENTNEKSKEKDQSNNIRNQKKIIKPQDTKINNIKESGSKFKFKQNDKDADLDNKKKVALKSKEIGDKLLSGLAKSSGNEENKHQVKADDQQPVLDKEKHLVKLKSGSVLEGASSKIKHSDTSKQAEDSDSDTAEAQEIPTNSSTTVTTANGGLGDKCESTTTAKESGICNQPNDTTTELSTCKQTNEIVPHEKTTCCKTTIRVNKHTKTTELTTLPPVKVKVDNLDTNHLSLTVVPVEPGRKRLPQSDPEFIHFGNVGEFSIVDESNGTVLNGQQAIDFLEYIRNNASEGPVIFHEEMH